MREVIVVGAGPAGLMLACELRLAGVDVLVLERLSGPDPTIKAGSITLPTASAFDRRGQLRRLEAAQERMMASFQAFKGALPKAEAGPPPPRFIGHFGGLPLMSAQLDESDPELAGHGPAAGVNLVSQQEVERALAEWAAELGVEIRRGVTVANLHADDEGVTISLEDGTIRTQWLVGCDGGRSTVRKRTGFDFPGTEPQITAYQAIADLSGTQHLLRGWNRTSTGVYAHGPVPGRILTVEFDGAPADRTGPVTPAELEASIRRVTGVDVTVNAISSVTRFTDNARQATSYRMGRVLLAGDAAHVHSPFGGQGLNLGVGDAVNLGWKLAATIHGWAPEGLLDTYTSERHPIGAWVLDWTRAQIAIMRPDPWADALRAVVSDLLGTRDGTTYAVKRLSGVWQRYDLPGDHPLVGRSAPDLELADGRRVAELLHSGPGLLLDLGDADRLTAVGAGYPAERLSVVRATCPERPELAGLLIRPDGVVAWAADREASPDGLEEAAQAWFGAPAAVLTP
jgi:2-polyprenyl-6-methoxyphenol hydroxylase-like FAD-dependent oxidoreductase